MIYLIAKVFFFYYYSLKNINYIFFFSGKRCEYLTSLSFVHNNSYAELEPLRTKPEANVTLVFSTEQENGVLLYDGQNEHLAVELFNGRVRVSYDVGNYPVSTMYRYINTSVRPATRFLYHIIFFLLLYFYFLSLVKTWKQLPIPVGFLFGTFLFVILILTSR